MSFALVGSIAAPIIGGLLSDNDAEEQAAQANQAATDATQLQTQITQDQWNRFKTIYDPLEREVVGEARNYGSPENYAKAAGDASATVSQQFGKARDRLSRTPGLDPSSGAYQASLVGLDMAQAATDATQQNLARKGVGDTAYARKTAALASGKGLDQTASSGLASLTQNNLALARAGNQQAQDQAQQIGSLTNRVVGALSDSDWLGGGAKTYPYRP